MTTFTEAASEYDFGRARWYGLREDAIAWKAALGEMRQQLKEAEAERIVNKGTEDYPINGTNPEQRGAQLLCCLANDPAYQELERVTARQESGLARLELDADDAANGMRLARYQMEWAISENNREAAALGSNTVLARA